MGLAEDSLIPPATSTIEYQAHEMRYDYRDYVRAVDTELVRLSGKTHLELDEWVDLRLGYLADMDPVQAATDILAELSY